MKTLEKNHKERINRIKESSIYRFWLHVRKRVYAMLDEMQLMNAPYLPSNYWQEELKSFEYIFDPSPLVLDRLREHCYHITGTWAYEYRKHHSHLKGLFANKLNLLRKRDKRGLFVPESTLLGDFGFNIDGYLVNLDTLKFYEALIAMDLGGILSKLESKGKYRKKLLR